MQNPFVRLSSEPRKISIHRNSRINHRVVPVMQINNEVKITTIVEVYRVRKNRVKQRVSLRPFCLHSRV